MPAKEENRCWPGYEPVKGKEPHSQGSCRPKADSKLTGSEKEFRGKREGQLADWRADHKGSKRSAAQHLQAPGAKTKASKSRAATQKPAKKKSVRSAAKRKRT